MIENPPSTGIAVPVTKSDALDARNTAMPAKSADSPHRAAGVRPIHEVRVGIDTAVPDRVLKNAACEPSLGAQRLAALSQIGPLRMPTRNAVFSKARLDTPSAMEFWASR
jgi:hypothetical protein